MGAFSLADIQAAMPAHGLFAGGSWLHSPEPLRLSAQHVKTLESMGHVLAQFQQASDLIYQRSAKGKEATWVAELLDRSKPSWLRSWQQSTKNQAFRPQIIRPDLILHDGGFAISELDSVPGGIGITAWLGQFYQAQGFNILGGSNGMLDGFKSLLPHGADIIISDESKDYLPEMQWLTSQLGSAWQIQAAESYQPQAKRDVYRFFELFDWGNIPCAQELAALSEQHQLHVSPPFKAHLEEKAWLALLWNPSLQSIWKKLLRHDHLERLKQWIPQSILVDPTPLPPHAALPFLNVFSWDEVAQFSQKQRQLVLKISGFHPTAWGSRGVFIGHDLPHSEWSNQLQMALNQFQHYPFIIQHFQESSILQHPVFLANGSVQIQDFRARLCPYYFLNAQGKTTLGGCLATLVPINKKKIHGMQDAVLVPCMLDA